MEQNNSSSVINYNRLWLPALEKAYPQAAEKSDPKAWLHYQVIHNRFGGSNDKITARMETSPGLCYQHPTTQQYPAGVMAMLGRITLLKALIGHLSPEEAKQSLNSADKRGWTAMHFISLTMPPDALAFFAKKGGDLAKKTPSGATPHNLAVLAGIVPEPTSFAAHTLIRCPDGRELYIPEIPSGTFPQLAPPWKVYRETPLYSPEALLQLWQSPEKSSEKCAEIDAICLKGMGHPVTLSIEPHPDIPNQVGVFTAQRIPAMSACCTYGGELPHKAILVAGLEHITQHVRNGTAPLYNLQAKADEVSGTGARINCGFDNVVIYTFEHNGCQQRIFITPYALPAHTELRYSYGPYPYWWIMPATILGWHQVAAYFEGGLKGVYQRLAQDEQNARGGDFAMWHCQRQLLSAQAVFPLEMPVSLLKLHLHEIVNAKEWQDALGDSRGSPFKDKITNVRERLQACGPYVDTWLKIIVAYDKATKPLELRVKRSLDKWLLKHLELMPPTDLSRAMLEMTEQAKTGFADIEAVETFLTRLSEQMSTYDWLQDPTNPFSLKQRMAKDFAALTKPAALAEAIKKPVEKVPQIYDAWLNELRTKFPRADYDKKPDCRLHFLSLHNRSAEGEKTTLSWVEKWAISDKDKLSHRDNKTKLDPVLICAMSGRKAVLEAILLKLTPAQQKAALNYDYKNGWTALHFAAVTMPEYLPALKEIAGNPNKLTRLGGNPEHVGMLARTIPPTCPSAQHVLLQTASGAYYPIGSVESAELSTLIPNRQRYQDLPNYSGSGGVQRLLNATPLSESSLRTFVTQLHGQWENSPANLYMTTIEGELGVFTADAYPEVRMIGTYGGAPHDPIGVTSTLEKCFLEYREGTIPKFRIQEVNAEIEGGIGPQIQHGWPSLIMVPANINGSYDHYLVSAGDLGAHQRLTRNQGPSKYTFVRPLTLHHWEEMCKFFEGGLFITLKRLENYRRIWGKDKCQEAQRIKTVHQVESGGFPLCAPQAVLKLHFTGVVKVSEWQSAVKPGFSESYEDLNGIIKVWRSLDPSYWPLMDVWLAMISNLQSQVTKVDKLVGLQITEWLLQHNEKLPPTTIAKAMQTITAALTQNSLSADNIKQFLELLTADMNTYEWLADEERPFKNANGENRN